MRPSISGYGTLMSPNVDETVVCGSHRWDCWPMEEEEETGRHGNQKRMRFPLTTNVLWHVVDCHGDF